MPTLTDDQYASLIDNCLAGEKIQTRNSICYRQVCGVCDFSSTPLVSARKTAWKNALREWEWFMSGSTNIKDLHPAVHSWWKPWTDPGGDVKYNYSHQFRNFFGTPDNWEGDHKGSLGMSSIDQIARFIDGIKDHPNSRRNVITTWNTADMLSPDCPITNCHGTVVQAFGGDRGLRLVTYQRSVDVVCGLPHNWIQYWAFLLWLGHRTSHFPSHLIWIGGDVHVYEAHKDIARKIVGAAPSVDSTPILVYTPTSEDFRADDFALRGEYEPRVLDRAEMIV